MKANMQLLHGDCLELMKDISDRSIDAVITDPPYNIKKADWDKWKTKESYIEWCGKWILECQRVLKDNGSFYFFHNDMPQIAMLMEWIRQNTRFIYNSFIIWDKGDFRALSWKNPSEKNKLRCWFQTCEYILFYTFQDDTGLEKILIRENYASISEKIKNYCFKNFKKEYLISLFEKEGRYTSNASARASCSYKLGWNKGKRFDLMDEKFYKYLNKKLHFPFSYEDLR